MRITPPISFHALRHTWSSLVRLGLTYSGRAIGPPKHRLRALASRAVLMKEIGPFGRQDDVAHLTAFGFANDDGVGIGIEARRAATTTM